jgi:hypothetical protein
VEEAMEGRNALVLLLLAWYTKDWNQMKGECSGSFLGIYCQLLLHIWRIFLHYFMPDI